MITRASIALFAFAVCLGAMALVHLEKPDVRIEPPLASFTTSLTHRTASQRHNALLACRALNNARVLPGRTFSFNQRVGNWTAAAGYRKAPVSYEGVLVRAIGGGVCQVSTTLYNAALMAGLPIVERHRHAVAPTYIAPGRDAAVAFDTLDLKFRNPSTRPITITAHVTDNRLTVSLTGGVRSNGEFAIVTRVIERERPRSVIVQSPSVRRPSQSQAAARPGYRVVTYRALSINGREVQRERISDDSYRTVHRVWFVSEGPMGTH